MTNSNHRAPSPRRTRKGFCLVLPLHCWSRLVFASLLLIADFGCSKKPGSDNDTETAAVPYDSDTPFSMTSDSEQTSDGDRETDSESEFQTNASDDTDIQSDTRFVDDDTDSLETSADSHTGSSTQSDIGSDTYSDRETVTRLDAGRRPIDTDSAPVTCDPVQFRDPNFEAVIREELEITSGQISADDISALTHLSFYSWDEVRSISGIECAQNLIRLVCEDVSIVSFDMLSSNTSLEDITIDNCGLADISFMRDMENLVRINLPYNRISSLDPLRGHQIDTLVLYDNPLTELSPLEEMRVTVLNLSNSGISSLPSLKNTGISTLNVSNNSISNITPIVNIAKEPNPEELPFRITLSGNAITNLSPFLDVLDSLSGVQLDLEDNPLSEQSLNDVIPQLCQSAAWVSWSEEGKCGALPLK